MKKAFLFLFISFCFGFSGLVLWAGSANADPPFPVPPEPGGLAQCLADLTTCEGDLAASDGFVDNGDGTVTDNRSGLMWEKKTGTVGSPVACTDATVCPDPNNVNNTYTWSSTGSAPDGTLYTAFLAQLNDVAGGGANCFAGYCDWRIPMAVYGSGYPDGAAELEGILSLAQGACGGGGGACISPVFGATATAHYWSSTTNAVDTSNAWGVGFYTGRVNSGGKSNNYLPGRAVR